jgi:transposase
MKRKKYSSAFKFKVALAAAKGDKTITEICQHFEIAASLVHKWKKELLENGAELFEGSSRSNKPKKSESDKDKKIRRLYEKVGQLTVDRDFLKKSWEKYQEESE